MAEAHWRRIVAHADMDAFYAAVEQLDHPELRGRPVLVGPRGNRGVVLTASYEARPHGVGSAMPIARARRLCPDAVTVPPRFDRYEELSATIMRVFGDFSPCVEALSLDEAFIELSGAERLFGPPERMARRIKEAVRGRHGPDRERRHFGPRSTSPRRPAATTSPTASRWCRPGTPRLGSRPNPCPGSLAPDRRRCRSSRRSGCAPSGTWRVAIRGCSSVASAVLGRISRRSRTAAIRDGSRVAEPRAAWVRTARCSRTSQVARRFCRTCGTRRIASEDGCAARAARPGASGFGLKTAHFEMLTRQCLLLRATDVADVLYETADRLLDSFGHPGPFRLVGMAAYDLSPVGSPEQLALFDPAWPSATARRHVGRPDRAFRQGGGGARPGSRRGAHPRWARRGAEFGFPGREPWVERGRGVPRRPAKPVKSRRSGGHPQ